MAGNILIAYYTNSSNTQKIAALIHRLVGGTLAAIEPETPYPTAYNACVEQAKKEIQAGFRPRLRTKIADLGAYDTVFIGTPNWWSTLAPPVATFLSESDLTGKTVIPFCSHGGGGGGRILDDVAKLCPHSTSRPGLVMAGDGGARAETLVTTWLRELEI